MGHRARLLEELRYLRREGIRALLIHVLWLGLAWLLYGLGIAVFANIFVAGAGLVLAFAWVLTMFYLETRP